MTDFPPAMAHQRAGGTVRTIIFDLSEVLIAGLIGIEQPLSEQLQVPEEEVLAAFGGRLLEDLCSGRVSEDSYLSQILKEQQWDISTGTLKHVIRRNLRRRVPGMAGLVSHLAAEYELVLLSDHAAEWIAYARAVHPFLEVFDIRVFSFETGRLKRDASTFEMLLEEIDRRPEECVFVDDSPLNVRVARAVGIESIQFVGVKHLVISLRSQGVLV
jgi:FMN phosphatase YigB (HAD superfamily)